MQRHQQASGWRSLVGPCLTADSVQARLAISPAAVEDLAARRRLLRVATVDGVSLYPLWQFKDNGKDDGVAMVDGLPDVLALFREEDVDGWTLVGWLRTPQPELGESPIQALARGDVARVMVVARTAARALST